jgi:hypothetical protein
MNGFVSNGILSNLTQRPRLCLAGNLLALRYTVPLDSGLRKPSPARADVCRSFTYHTFLSKTQVLAKNSRDTCQLESHAFLQTSVLLTDLCKIALDAFDVWHGGFQEDFDLATGFFLLCGLGTTV